MIIRKPTVTTCGASGVRNQFMGVVTTTEYDANGNVTAETDKFGNRTSYTYDAFDRLTTVVSPEGVVLVRYIYDPAGNCISQTDALNNVTLYEYNGSGQVSKTIDGEGNITIQTYDAMGNVAAVTDGEDHTTTYTYDGFGRLLSVTAADGTKTTYSYDPWGNLRSQTDGKNNRTEYTYNAANLPLTKTESGTATVAYTYYGDGSVKTMTDAAGTVNTYVYNVHGELVSETATGADGTTSTYTYDKNGNLLSMTDGSGTTTYRYDELGRVTEKDTPEFGRVTYTYDLTSGMEPGCHYELQNDPAGSTRTVYDRQNRVIKVTTQSADGAPETVEISYYDNGARERVTYGDGSSEYYTFYGNNMVKGVTNKLPDGTVIDQFSYVYDGAGNLISKTELANGKMRGTITYTYDKQNRLKSVTEPEGRVISYTYDGAGNRATETTTENGVETVKTYTYNGRNQLLTVEQKTGGETTAKISYTYDANGNQLTETRTVYGSATESGEDETTTLLTNTYDLRNQLIKSVTADATITNTYNAAGYRVGKSVTENGKTSKTYFLYDGSNVIMEADEEGVTAKNTYGGPLLLRTVFGDAGEETYQYLYNAHGDVVTLLANGEVAATYYYDSFGNILEQTGEVDNSILYAGYQYDEETGLYYINARMYDPVTARFLQADTYLGNLNDPLSLNLYTYCLNNPHKYADPSGHFAITAAVIIGAIIWGIVGAAVEYKAQKDAGGMIDYNQVLFQGILNAGLALATAGLANGAMATAQGARMTAGAFGRMLLAEAGLGIAEGIISETGRQLIAGTKPNELDAGSIAYSGAMGGILSVGGVFVGQGIDIGLKALKNSRMVSRIVSKARNLKNKGLDAVQTGFDRIANKGSKAAGEAVIDSLDEPVRKLNLQFFASDEVYKTSYGKSSGKYSSTFDFVNDFEKRNNNFYTDKSTIDTIGRIEARGEDFTLLSRKRMNSRPSSEGGLSTIYRYSDENGTKYMIHEVTDNQGFIIHRDFDAIRLPSGQLINKK